MRSLAPVVLIVAIGLTACTVVAAIDFPPCTTSTIWQLGAGLPLHEKREGRRSHDHRGKHGRNERRTVAI